MAGESQDATAMFLLADRIYDGNLKPQLRQWRAAGVSLRAIQALLSDQLGRKPALETVRRWVRVAENGHQADVA